MRFVGSVVGFAWKGSATGSTWSPWEKCPRLDLLHYFFFQVVMIGSSYNISGPSRMLTLRSKGSVGTVDFNRCVPRMNLCRIFYLLLRFSRSSRCWWDLWAADWACRSAIYFWMEAWDASSFCTLLYYLGEWKCQTSLFEDPAAMLLWGHLQAYVCPA